MGNNGPEVEDVINELASAIRKFPAFNSGHEGYAVILEEMDELWIEAKNNKRPDIERKMAMYHEAKQVAAMALRFMIDCCEESSNARD